MKKDQINHTNPITSELLLASSESKYTSDQPSYIPVSKSLKNFGERASPTYIHVSKLVSLRDDSLNFFEGLEILQQFGEVMKYDIAKKLIYLSLQTSRIYCGLAMKSLKIQALQFERQIKKLTSLGIIERAELEPGEYDPFLRWVKQANPNLPIKKLKLYRLTSSFRSLFSKLEQDLESSLDPQTADEIRHYRYQINRTHKDIQREKRIKNLQQKKLVQDAKLNKHYSDLIGACSECGTDCVKIHPTRKNPQTEQNYREVKGKLTCNDCHRKLYLNNGTSSE